MSRDSKRAKETTYSLCIASKMMNIEIKIKKIPLAKPDKVSIRPYLEILEVEGNLTECLK
jgi:hypothetical protein